jgi:hypothetical protein
MGLLVIGVLGTEGRVILLKCDSPCRPERAGAWRYVATVLTADDAKHAGFLGYSAPDLFARGGAGCLIVSPTSDRPVKGAYNGCDVFRFADLERGRLERDHDAAKNIKHIHGHANTFNGACTYQAASGFLFGEVKFAERPIFQIFQSGGER